MRHINLRSLDDIHLPVLETWFEDPELQGRLGGMLPLEQWFRYVQSEPGYHAWMAFDGDAPVGMVAVETYPDRTGCVAYLVKPEFRGQGYGKSLLRAVLARPEVNDLREVTAFIEPDNVASIRSAEAASFSAVSETPDAEGFLLFACVLSDRHESF